MSNKHNCNINYQIRGSSESVFITRTGSKVTRSRLNHSFTEASKKAGIKKITPEILRSVFVIFKQQGFKDDAIFRSK